MLALLRHGPTAWNAEKRLQGRSDEPLSREGRDKVRSWHMPGRLAGFVPVSSPLLRARETAQILFGDHMVEPLLTEMSFGDWEGCTLSELRTKLGKEMVENEARGLDFHPPNGESPRQVLVRIRPLLQEWARHTEQYRVCVTHKGVIRALYADAVGWDMTGKIPDRLNWDAVHLFDLDRHGAPKVVALNLPLRQNI